jgi:hypothetical protein
MGRHPPGFVEIELVTHDGSNASVKVLRHLTAIDIAPLGRL